LVKRIEDCRHFLFLDLRPTERFSSRLTQAGVSPVFVAQIMGHSGPGVLQIYPRAIDEYRRSAIAKLEALREAQFPQPTSGGQQLIQ